MSLQSVMRRGTKRAMYDFLSGNEPVGFFDYAARMGRSKKIKPKKVYVDKNGNQYWGQDKCVFGDKKLYVRSVDGGYVYTNDDKRHHVSSVEFTW